MLDSYGISGKAETPQACRGGERISPHGKRASCNGNQHHAGSFYENLIIMVGKIVFQQRDKKLTNTVSFFISQNPFIIIKTK
ncbi:hypothetical protein COJ46_21880 [Bacillus sp. AFS077874]|uniref:hypothetical protein n=1 Tax=Bacillus sp. AFS077874 TaxID=2033513 RepID=UPI000BF5347D|nr:hypothetical protein [Bacillus sp. AFS077874]PFM75461.1 hypothetical protein COJ46_21880 [Bacillus sp. AFS077874]